METLNLMYINNLFSKNSKKWRAILQWRSNIQKSEYLLSDFNEQSVIYLEIIQKLKTPISGYVELTAGK
jgi:hypothetical protein